MTGSCLRVSGTKQLDGKDLTTVGPGTGKQKPCFPHLPMLLYMCVLISVPKLPCSLKIMGRQCLAAAPAVGGSTPRCVPGRGFCLVVFEAKITPKVILNI